MLSGIIYALFFGLGCILALVCIDFVRKLLTDSATGLKGPRPLPLIGNLHSIVKKGVSKFDSDVVHQYGNIARFYEGKQLNVLVADKDEIKNILLINSKEFRNRQVLSAANLPPICYGLPSLLDNEWTHVRSICNDFFTDESLAKLLPSLAPLLQELVNKFVKLTERNEPVNVEGIFSEFAAQVIAVLIFGDQNTSDIHQFMEAMESLRNPSYKELKFAALTLCPFASPIMNALNCGLVDKSKLTHLSNQIEKSINNRFDSQHYNFVTFARDAKDKEGKGLSFDHILGQAITFYLAGQHTISLVLAFATYHLAIDDSDLQRRASTEAYSIKTDQLPSIVGARLLTRILMETIRMYPPSIRIDRVAETSDMTAHIPAKATVVIPLPALHSQVNDPSVFDPERSILDDCPGNFEFIPFGRGPRFCVGKRLAMIVMTATLAALLSSIEFKPCALTEVPLKIKKKTCNRTENGIWLAVSHK